MIRILGCAAVALTLSAAGAAAQDYPARPITLVAGFAAGTGTDAIVRTIAAKLSERLKQQVVVENKPGANAMIGTEYVARAAPDGYTLLFATSSSHSSNPSLFKTLPYDPVKDFTPIGRTVDVSYVLMTGANLPAKSVAEMVALAKAKPEPLTYAAPNGPSLVISESVRAYSGTKLVGVPYKSVSQALTDFVGGRIDLYVVDLPTAMGVLQAKQANAIAVTTKSRSKLLPDLPPLADTWPGFDVVSWGGIVGPAKLPRAVVDKISAELRAILTDQDLVEKLAAGGYAAAPSASPEEFAGFIAQQVGVWKDLVTKAGIQPQ
jgi:tripartite-type tricarboxylate transporter receptor subunit TctC